MYIWSFKSAAQHVWVFKNNKVLTVTMHICWFLELETEFVVQQRLCKHTRSSDSKVGKTSRKKLHSLYKDYML